MRPYHEAMPEPRDPLSEYQAKLRSLQGAQASVPGFLASGANPLNRARLTRFYQSGIDRLTGTWAGKGVTGEAFSRPDHLYERDLNIFGAGSVFEFLCTARTQAGQRRLASYLLDLPPRPETLARQQAVQELGPLAELRERICLLGKYSTLTCDFESFNEWLDAPAAPLPRLVSLIVAVVSAALTVLFAFALATNVGARTTITPYLMALGLLQLTFALTLRPKMQPVAESGRGISSELSVLREGLALMEAYAFRSPKLESLKACVKGSAQAVGKLDRLIDALDQSDQPWFYGLTRILLVDTQIAISMERWKVRHGKHLGGWLDAWAEFEALNALACYAYEHPPDVFPEILDGSAPRFEAVGLAHPLLPESIGVRNDIELNSARKFYLVSGSNMAGKSTLLRAIALNAVLGCAGAPVRAFRARQSSLSVCASLSIVDSLAEGKSKFMAEVERLRDILQSASDPGHALFVIDEILAGTNSRDRRIASESFLRALIGAGAIGALSTHDLALTEIAAAPELHGSNVHMESPDPSDPLAFDYLLKPGIAERSNALAIARMAGVAT